MSVPPNQRRGALYLQWVRNMHGWIGLWGAILGLLFGTSGIWLNHRDVLKLPLAQQRVNGQLALPEPAPADAEAMGQWLRQVIGPDHKLNAVRVDKARPVAWTEKGRRTGEGDGTPLMQPERWVFNFGGPQQIIQAEYWRGNRSVGLNTTSNGSGSPYSWRASPVDPADRHIGRIAAFPVPFGAGPLGHDQPDSAGRDRRSPGFGGDYPHFGLQWFVTVSPALQKDA